MRRIIRRVARQYLVGMLQKRWMVALLAVALGAVCAYKFTDWLSPPTIQILKLDRPVQYGRVSRNVMPVTFTLERRYRLTEVKVIPVDAMKTNKNPRPVWHLVSKSGSPPLKGLAYGQPIRGMKSVLDKVGAEPLQPGITYRLLIRAGRARGELDFRVEPAPLERN